MILCKAWLPHGRLTKQLHKWAGIEYLVSVDKLLVEPAKLYIEGLWYYYTAVWKVGFNRTHVQEHSMSYMLNTLHSSALERSKVSKFSVIYKGRREPLGGRQTNHKWLNESMFFCMVFLYGQILSHKKTMGENLQRTGGLSGSLELILWRFPALWQSFPVIY